MYVTESPIMFSPVSCYEELRFNILEESFYSSYSLHLLQNQGMAQWFKNLDILNKPVSCEPSINEVPSLPSIPGLKFEERVRNKLSILLADIILNIYPEAIYA